ncbi:SpoIIAA family protein [Arthrobacter sp. MMS24-T111]
MGKERPVTGVVVDGGKGTVALRPDGIIHLIWNTQVRIEAQDARAAMTAVNTVAGGSEYPMLVDMATTESVAREARSVFSIPCAANRIALLGASPVDRVLANFFLNIHIPPCPTRFFTSRDDALAWLVKDVDR